MIALVAVDCAGDADVDNDATLLLVVLRPVDSEPMPVDVEVQRDATELVADDSPLDADVEGRLRS
ncbi:hypothetical protein AAHH80_41245, partial [Burkholderia pseudomallei]